MKKPVIICIDDEKAVLDSLKVELNDYFSDMLSVELAESALESLEVINDLIKKDIEVPIIISDWLMHGMKGDELLIEIHTLLPNSKKIMLTGHATLEGVANAINHAMLYRFIAKPWNLSDLRLTIREAFKSYYHEKKIRSQYEMLKELNASLEKKVRNRTAECELQRDIIQELFDKTLKGSVAALIEVITRYDIKIYDKTIRMKEIARNLALHLKLNPIWEFEIAAMLSQIGCLYINKDIVRSVMSGSPISQSEQETFYEHTKKSYSILKKIPKLENISLGVLNMFSNKEVPCCQFDESEQSIRISKLLRVVHDYDDHILSGKPSSKAIEYMKHYRIKYDPYITNALDQIYGNEKEPEE
jgi:response regulator RpfG family c-di-GMP phosphodiesterase